MAINSGFVYFGKCTSARRSFYLILSATLTQKKGIVVAFCNNSNMSKLAKGGYI
jgi:hypothetical protein